MPLGLNIVVNADGSKAVANIGAVQASMNKLADTAKGELTQKMKMIFSAAAIEQAAQRTGEWAQQLTQTAKAMGVTNEVLQTLNILGSKTNTPKEAVISMFEAIDKARNDALNGNVELQASFQRMGVTLDDLRTKTKSGLFSQVMGNINGKVSSASNLTRQDMQAITGGAPENFIDNIKAGLGSQTFEGYKESQVGEGGVLPEGVVNDLSKTWGELLVDLNDLGNELKPAAGLLIMLARLLVNTLGGIIGLFKDIWSVLSGLLSGDTDKMLDGFKKIGSLVAGLGIGFLKAIASVLDLLVKAILSNIKMLFGHLPVIGKKINEMVDNAADAISLSKQVDKLEEANKEAVQTLGISGGEKRLKQGSAITDTALLLASGGEAGLAKMAQMATSAAAKGAGRIGAVNLSESLIASSSRFGDAAAGRTGLFGDRSLLQKSQDKGLRNTFNDVLEDINTGKYSPERTAARNNRALSRYNMLAAGARVASLAGGIGGAIGAGKSLIASDPRAVETTPIIPKIASFASAGSSETSMLKIGGLFGSNFQMRMIQLNQEMVKALSQIEKNTSAAQQAQFNQPTTP